NFHAIKNNAFPITVLAGSLYLGLGRLKNLREGQGCPKCETAQAWSPSPWLPGQGGNCGKATRLELR
ncbi:hypothetical protein, partial [Meiothermus taiwanensis]|uniref:hypothetical protein n=1 Tax=Meiothermus taiwanensis TaxID=172827 RepID=UPI001680D9A6